MYQFQHADCNKCITPPQDTDNKESESKSPGGIEELSQTFHLIFSVNLKQVYVFLKELNSYPESLTAYIVPRPDC